MKSAFERSYLPYFILSLIGYSIYVIMDAICKKLISTYHVSQIVFINSLFALVPISLFVTYKKGWKQIKKFNLKVQIARGLCNFLAMTIFFISSHYLSLISLYSIVFIAPLLLTMGANFFLGEKVGWRRYSAVIVGFIGVIISINPLGETYNKFALLALLSPFFAATGWLIIKKYGEEESIYSFMVYGKIFLISCSGILLIYFFKQESRYDLFLNIISGLIRGLGILLTFIAASKLPSSLFAPTQYVQVFSGAVIGYLYFGDIPTLNNFFGNLLIIGAGIYIIFRELKLSKNIVSKSIRPAVLPIQKD
jgi:drug/metabolite transporter (DMT)-like permease